MTYKRLELVSRDGMSRVARLRTPHGMLDTPTVFPVHNLGAQRGWNTPRYWETFPCIRTAMFSAYHIIRNRRRLKDKINLVGGVHNLLDFGGIAFVDSGGFLNLGTSVYTDQESILKVQEAIGADIASTLDFPFNMRLDQRIFEKMTRSISNAYEASSKRMRKEMLLFASVHGNDAFLLRNILRHLSRSNAFDGYAVGSLLPIRSDLRFVVDLVISLRSAIADEPLHIFGLGGPMMVPMLIYLGVDSSDSSSFVICGSKRVYFVPGDREVSMEKLSKDSRLPCDCKVCSQNTVEEMRKNRNLMALHNLWAVWREVEEARLAIKEQRLEDHLNRRYSNALVMRDIFEYAKRRVRNLVQGNAKCESR